MAVMACVDRVAEVAHSLDRFADRQCGVEVNNAVTGQMGKRLLFSGFGHWPAASEFTVCAVKPTYRLAASASSHANGERDSGWRSASRAALQRELLVLSVMAGSTRPLTSQMRFRTVGLCV